MQKKNRNGMLKHCFMIAAVLAAFLFAAGCNPPTGNDGKTGNEGKNGTEKEGGTTTPGGETSGGEQPGGEQPGGEQPGEEEGQGNGGGPITPPAVDETEVKLTLKDVVPGSAASPHLDGYGAGAGLAATGVEVKAMVETSKKDDTTEVGKKLKAAVKAKIDELKAAASGFDFEVFKKVDGSDGKATADTDYKNGGELFIGKKAAAAGTVTPKITLVALPADKAQYLVGTDEGMGYEGFTDGAMLVQHTAASAVASSAVSATLVALVKEKVGGDTSGTALTNKTYKLFKKETTGAYTVVDLASDTLTDGQELYVGKQMPSITLKVKKTSAAKAGYAAANIGTVGITDFDGAGADLAVYIPSALKTAGYDANTSAYQDAVDKAVNAKLYTKLSNGSKTAKLFKDDTTGVDRPSKDQLDKASTPFDLVYIAIAD